MSITIRRASTADIHEIIRIFRSAITQLAKGHYSPRQIEKWLSRLSPDTVRDGITIGCAYIAEVDGQAAGFGRIDIHDSELAMLYVDPEHAHQGVGTALLRHLEQAALDNGLESLSLRASLNAAPFYEAMGYIKEERIIHRIDDVDFECINMHKNLAITYTGDCPGCPL